MLPTLLSTTNLQVTFYHSLSKVGSAISTRSAVKMFLVPGSAHGSKNDKGPFIMEVPIALNDDGMTNNISILSVMVGLPVKLINNISWCAYI